MSLRILIVDDSATNRLLFTTIAVRMGHSAEAVASGREALSCHAEKAYDIVFIDLQMPQMDGFSLAQHMRQLYPHHPRTIPLYAVSGFIDAETEKRAMAAGFHGCFTKPLDREKISICIAEHGLDGKTDTAPQSAGNVPPDIPARLLDTYARELRTRAAACENHWEMGDIPALRREAHTLRALADMLKTADVAEAAAGVEKIQRSLFAETGADTENTPRSEAHARVKNLASACLQAAASIETRAAALSGG